MTLFELYLIGTAAVVSGLTLFQWVVMPVVGLINSLKQLIAAQTK